jgi:outer membrane protein assembly factor BamB
MDAETLEDHLRRATRGFTARLGEERVLALGRELAAELVAAHAETPARHPSLDPATIPMVDGRPRLAGGTAEGDAGEDVFALGCLLATLAGSGPPDVSWRLDGPPAPEATTLVRRAALRTLAAPRRAERYATAADALEALDAAIAPASGIEAPWPVFRGGPERTGARPGPAPAAIGTAWHAAIGAVVASPVVLDTLVIAATTAGRLVFVERATGRVLHEVVLGSAIESSPLLAGGLVWVGTDDGALVSVDVATGAPRTASKVGRLVRSSPLALADRVIVGVVEGKDAGGVAALDLAGKLLWIRRLKGAVFSTPARAGSSIVVGCDDTSLVALDPEKGAPVWKAPLLGKVRATPAVAGGLVYAADFAGRVAAVREGDGSPAWTRELGHSIYSSPCVAGALVVVGCHEGHVHGLDAATGEPRFETATRGPVVASPAAIGDHVLAASTDGALLHVDPAGAVRARVALSRDGIQSSPALAPGEAFVGSADGLHALRLSP